PQHYHYIPLPENSRFVGRRTILDDLRQKLFCETQTRTVAVVGLGGVGKTQVALHVAYWAKKNRPEYSVLWVPALSDASFEQACMEITKALGIRRADDEDIRDAVRQHLSSNKAGHWLLVVDNADDKDMLFWARRNTCEQGLILFTTRFEEIEDEVSGSDVIELGDMGRQEATGLLERHLRCKEQLLSDEARTAKLLRDLAYLPLAITQAAAYI
ncbi:P-loop containing nucleoside triphosphate hydrolase protein, partial [Rhypophila sp. PSN 637]